MDTAIQIAATNYYLLQTIKNKNSAIKDLITERWRDLLPTLGVNVIRQRYIITDSNDYIYNGIMLTADQVIYDGGRKGLDLDIAKLEELLSKEEFKITYARLKLDVEKNFMNVLIASGKIALNKKSLERAREQLRLVKLELELGFTTDVQVMSILSRQQEIEFALTKSKNEFLKAKNELKQIMGLSYEADLILEGDLLRDFLINKPTITKNTLIERARNERPEIMRAKVNHHKVEKEKDLAENAWIPQISVGGAYGRTGIEYPLRNDAWNVNFKVTFPLGGSTNTLTENTGVRYNNLANSGFGGNTNPNFNSSTNNDFQFLNNMGYSRKVMESKIKLGAAISERKHLERGIAIEVEKSADSVLEAYDLIRIGSGAVFFRYESLKLMTTRSQVGEAKRADILFAETELVEAQEKLVEALGKYMISSYELEWVSGMVPQTMKLFEYSPKNGNTILPFLLLDKPIDKKGIPEGLRPTDLDEFFDKDIDTTPEEKDSLNRKKFDLEKKQDSK
ncbi:channel protein TolC [Leptospira kobayashii]|uniref:Channel protein TolC n=1 Tax=Leptospira kobayashii TaxID=1917830 RepID=A0ABM7UH28_9LEPT|nr:channel protein TolC [Leptospira kobayashii]